MFIEYVRLTEEEMTPKWLHLMRSLSANPEIALEAPTVAFLVGGSRESLVIEEVSADEAYRELLTLATSFIDDAPEDYVVSIYRCAKISQPTVRLVPAPYCRSASYAIESLVQTRVTVVLEAEFADGDPSAGSLADCLFRELGTDICAGRFSYRDGRYRTFNAREIDFIEGSLEFGSTR